MGSFIANVQVRATSGGAASLAAVESTLRAELLKSGQYRAAPAGSDGDRSVALLQRGDWISVFDERLDGQDVGALDEMAALTSSALKTWALGVLVHDSDVLLLRLHRDGALVDQFNSDPEYFGHATAKERKAATGRAQKWKELLAPGSTVGALRATLAETEGMAEELLQAVAGHVGLDDTLVMLSHDYLTNGGQPELAQEATRIRLERVPLPPEKAALLQMRVPPPEPWEREYPKDGEVWIGESIGCEQSFVCDAPITQALRVEIGGSAISGGQIVVGLLAGSSSADMGAETAGKIENFALTEGADGRREGLIAARLLPAAGALRNPGKPRLWLSVRPYFQPKAIGEGEAWIRVTPTENPQGAAEARYRYLVRPAPPLVFPAGAWIRSARSLRRLYRPQILSSLVVLKGSRAAMERTLLASLQDWAAFLLPEASGAWTTLEAGMALTFTSTAAGLADRLVSIFRGASDDGLQLFALEPAPNAPPVEGFPGSPRKDGFSATQLAPGLVQVGLWARRERLDPEREAAAVVLLRKQARAASEAGLLVQAALARQDWGPVGGPFQRVQTAYEDVANGGYAQPEATAVEECLRNFGDDLWLGPALLARLTAGNIAGLDGLVDLEFMGGCMHLRLRTPGDLEALARLERALANVVPRPQRFAAPAPTAP